MSRWEIGPQIGAGVSGSVHRAWDRERNRPVALKLVPVSSAAEAAQVVEAATAFARVDHPNVVRLVAIEADEGEAREVRVAMELVEGVDFVGALRPPRPAEENQYRPSLLIVLGARVQEGGESAFSPLTVPETAQLRGLLEQLANGVAAIHRAGLVHGDLQPANVLVEHGRVVIVDFGLAAPIDAVREGLVGAPEYMAPEQGGAPAIPASDVYAMGVILFQALTGAPPFDGSAQEVMVRKQTIGAPCPSLLVPVCDDLLDTLCVEMLRRAPELRPTAAEIAERLAFRPSQV
jgi:serine/threonine protein kinase